MQITRWIVVGVAFAGTGALMGAAFFYLSHHHSEQASAQMAEAEFERLRARFAGQSPLLDMRERRPLIDASAQQTAAPLHTFHAMIFDTQGGQRIVRISMPYRFGRLFGRRGGFRWLGQLTFLDDTEFDPEPIQLSLNQLAPARAWTHCRLSPRKRRPVHRLVGIAKSLPCDRLNAA